ncbi:MAG: single-stranded-DNA-specific exonuclease RecJ [Thermoplasmatota archaeon]
MKSVKGEEWRFRDVDEELALALSSRLSISSLLARILSARGFSDPEEVYAYLHPTLRNLHDPLLMKDMERAVNVIGRALAEGDNILVYGDYDADGITAAALAIRMLGTADSDSVILKYLPSRHEEGYGLSRSGIDTAVDSGADLIITVDCGIKAVEETAYAVEKGVDVIVTDHHEPGKTLPGAKAVIDPKRPDCMYPFKEIAGVGVAFKLAWALQTEGLIRDDVRNYLDLVALGTVADLVPLVDENRAIVSEGLRQLRNTDNLGIRALMRESGIDPFLGITSADIAFKMGPRINSAGRLGNPDMALDMLLTGDRVDADLFARQLNTLNFKRKAIGNRITDEVREQITVQDLGDDPIIVVGKEGWHPGVLGISASSIMGETGKPTIILSIEGDTAKGSARAPAGFDLIGALDSCGQILLEHGGHELAAGVTLHRNSIPVLRSSLIDHLLKNYPDRKFVPVKKIDVGVALSELTLDELSDLELMSPTGKSNEQPMIHISSAHIGAGFGTVGDGKHLKFRLQDDESSVDCIWFGMGGLSDELFDGIEVEVVGIPDIHRWNGRETPQIRVLDMRI